MLRRRAAAAFRSTKPSGRMEARSLRRTVPVIRFHRRIRRRSMVAERGCLGLRMTVGLGNMCERENCNGLPRSFVTVVVGGGRNGREWCVCDNWASHCVMMRLEWKVRWVGEGKTLAFWAAVGTVLYTGCQGYLLL